MWCIARHTQDSGHAKFPTYRTQVQVTDRYRSQGCIALKCFDRAAAAAALQHTEFKLEDLSFLSVLFLQNYISKLRLDTFTEHIVIRTVRMTSFNVSDFLNR